MFCKNLSQDRAVKWAIHVGVAYKRGDSDGKIFIPVKILGMPLASRSTIISYVMNLEMLDVLEMTTKDYKFETIWPFILYLFNNWVTHQVTLMGIKRILPGMADRLPKEEYTMFEVHNDLQQDFEALEDIAHDDMLNFSSEIEFDERFDGEGRTAELDKVVDKSRPEGFRPSAQQVKQNNRNKLFNEYK